MERNRSSIIWGLVIIAVGVIFLGNSIKIWDVDIFFDGWWTLFLIIPSLIGLIKGEFFSSILCLSVGILFLLAAQDVIAWSMVGKIFIPILLIMIGLSIIFKPRLKVKTIRKNNKNVPEYVGIFSGTEEKISEKFEGASCVAVFGGVDLDLTTANITEDTVIDCVTVFGGIDIKVPDNVIVKTTGTPIFGGTENKAKQNITDASKTIYINYVCVFGGIEIK